MPFLYPSASAPFHMALCSGELGFVLCRDIHVTDADAQAESGLTVADRRLLIGALEYKEKRVKDVMTALEHTFLLEERSRLNFSTMLAIYKVRLPHRLPQLVDTGRTRLPLTSRPNHQLCGEAQLFRVCGRAVSRASLCTRG